MDLNKTYDTWQKAISNPDKFFSKAKANPDLTTAVKWAALGGIVSVFCGQLELLVHSRTDIASALVGTIISGAIVVPLFLLITSGVLLLFAKLLGGRGTFNAQTYAMAALQAPLSILTAIIALVLDILFVPATYTFGVPVRTGIPGLIYGIASLVILAYLIYAMVMAFRNVHKYSTMRAIATFLVPAVLAGIAAVLAVMFFTVAGFSTSAV